MGWVSTETLKNRAASHRGVPSQGRLGDREAGSRQSCRRSVAPQPRFRIARNCHCRFTPFSRPLPRTEAALRARLIIGEPHNQANAALPDLAVFAARSAILPYG